MEPKQNHTYGKSKTFKKGCPSAALYTKNLIRMDSDANPVLSSEKPETNLLGQGWAVRLPYCQFEGDLDAIFFLIP
jgi:hypothetical protein